MGEQNTEQQLRAFEVIRIDKVGAGQFQPAITTQAATVWDKAEAMKLDKLVNPNSQNQDPFLATSLQRIREIGVIVCGENAYYDVMLPPVPAVLIFDTAEHAAPFLPAPYVDLTVQVASISN